MTHQPGPDLHRLGYGKGSGGQ